MLDYCTFMTSEHERAFLPLHLNSLGYWYYNDSPNPFNIKVCVVEGDEETIECCKQFPVEIIPLPTFRQETGLDAKNVDRTGQDIANRLRHMMEISTADWVVLAHLDIVYFDGGLLSLIDKCSIKDVGMIGEFCHGLTVVNKSIYDVCHFGFWALRRFHVETMPENLFHFHGRCSCPEHVDGYGMLDTGALLGIEMEAYGYSHERELIGGYDHASAQSGHVETFYEGEQKEKLVIERIQRKEDFISRYERFE